MKLQSLPAVSTVLLIFDRVNDAIAITIYPALNCKINKHAIGVSAKATTTMSTHFPANVSKHIWLKASPPHTPTTAQSIFLYKQAISTATLATIGATVSTQLILAVNNNHNVTTITMPSVASIFFDDNLLPAFFVNSNNINIINNINSNTNIGYQTHISNNSASNSSSDNNYNGERVDHDNTTTITTTYGNESNLNWIVNTTNSHDNDNLNSFYFYETEQFAVLWILFIVIVLGNSAVLLVMFMNKNRKSRMNYFIKQLALADLCVGLLHVLTDIIWHLTVSWRAGNIACKIIRFSQVCVTYSSTYVLVAMSIDRYDAITHPMNFSKSWKRARHLVAAAWIISAIFALPILLLYEEKSIQGRAQCWIELGTPLAWQIYMSLVSATLFAFPALIISACYTIIVKTIWAKGSMFVSTGRGSFMETNTRRASSRGNIPKAKVKTIKMTFVIVIVFIVCWSPYIIFDLLQVFGHVPQSQTNIAIATFIQSLAPLNSAANPLIYCLFSSTVFRTFSRLPPFKWFSCCCKTYRQNPSTQPRCSTVGRRLHNSCDSMRTTTTSLTVSRRSQKGNTHVMICERPKSHSLDHNALSQV